MDHYFAYIIKSASGIHYIGQIKNLSDRILRHNNNRNKFTKGKGPWDLIISFQVNSRSEAVKLESYLKNMKNPRKAIIYLERLNRGIFN